MPPPLVREDATLRQAKIDTIQPPEEAGTNQKIPQTPHFVSAKKVWWDDQAQDAQRDLNKKEEHDAASRQH